MYRVAAVLCRWWRRRHRVRSGASSPTRRALSWPIFRSRIPIRTGLARTVTTNAQGEYVAPELAVGTYNVTVKAPNFKESVQQCRPAHIQTQTFNIQLQVGSTSEQVTVAASEVQVQTDNAALGEVVTGEQVRELPLNGRSFVQLTQLQPGVSAADNFSANNKGLLAGVDFSVNGNATTNNLFLVDGANNNDVGSNRTILIYPSIEAISEFKMLRNSYGPEYGQASGAVINIVTRSGIEPVARRRALLRPQRCPERRRVVRQPARKARGSPSNPSQQGKNECGATTTATPSAGRSRKTSCSSSGARNGTKRSRGITRRRACRRRPSAAAISPTQAAASHSRRDWWPLGLANPATPYNCNALDTGGATLAQWLPLPNLTPWPNGQLERVA